MTEYKGAVVVLIPDDNYATTVVDAHLTLVWNNDASNVTKDQLRQIVKQVEGWSRHLQVEPLNAKLNGVGVFAINPEYNDGNKFCYIDLVDSRQLPVLRHDLGWFNTSEHGFIPHITRAYAQSWIPSLLRVTGQVPINFAKIGLWIKNDERIEFDL